MYYDKHFEGRAIATITNNFMRQSIAGTKKYTIVILKAGQCKTMPGVDKSVWEHGRRNFSLRAEGLLPIVCPVVDGSDVSRIGIFNLSVEETKKVAAWHPLHGSDVAWELPIMAESHIRR